MMTSRVLMLLVLGLCVLGFVASAPSKQVTFTIDVPPGRGKALKMPNLHQDTLVTVKIQSSDDIKVAFVSATDYRRSPTSVRPLFHGQVETRLSFSVNIPATDDYLVAFDNHNAAAARAVTVTIRVTRGHPSDPTQAMHRAFEHTLHEFERQLNQVFVFKPVPIRVQACGAPRAFSGPSGIVLCREFAVKLLATLKDREKANNALLFAIFHELGHVLLAQWQYPFYDNEEIVDEFATALMVMFGQKERVRSGAEYFTMHPSVTEVLGKLLRDDRHPLSVQRARNILRWLTDPQLAYKWQKILVPHMQTAMLERLQRQPTTWTDRTRVEQELVVRRQVKQ